MKQLNVVLMTSRSGSSMVCGILAAHGLGWQDGTANPLQPARGHDTASYHTYEHPSIKQALKKCTRKDPRYQFWPKGDLIETENWRLDILKKAMRDAYQKEIDFVKVGVEFYQLMQDWGDLNCVRVNFIKVYRPPEDIAASLERRGIGSYELGYEVAVKRIKLMDAAPGITVATNMLVDEVDWPMSNIKEAVESCGIDWDPEMTGQAIYGEKFHV